MQVDVTHTAHTLQVCMLIYWDVRTSSNNCPMYFCAMSVNWLGEVHVTSVIVCGSVGVVLDSVVPHCACRPHVMPPQHVQRTYIL